MNSSNPADQTKPSLPSHSAKLQCQYELPNPILNPKTLRQGKQDVVKERSQVMPYRQVGPTQLVSARSVASMASAKLAAGIAADVGPAGRRGRATEV